MKSICLIFFFIATLAYSETCSIDEKTFVKFLEQDFWTFDQTEKGWRSVEKSGDKFCHLETAQLIDTYHFDKLETLKDFEKRILAFHAGQHYGFSNAGKVAIRRFEKSINKDEKENPDLHWNAYVQATLAFLKQDKEALLKAKESFGTAPSAGDKANLKIVENFISCFEKTYKEAYSGSCK